MRIQFKMEGGIAFFPGLSQPITLDSDHLPEVEAAELKHLVAAARFFDRSRVVGPPPPLARDYYQYTITVDEAGRRHTVEVTDPVEDPDLERLLAFLKAQAKALRRAGRMKASDEILGRD